MKLNLQNWQNKYNRIAEIARTASFIGYHAGEEENTPLGRFESYITRYENPVLKKVDLYQPSSKRSFLSSNRKLFIYMNETPQDEWLGQEELVTWVKCFSKGKEVLSGFFTIYSEEKMRTMPVPCISQQMRLTFDSQSPLELLEVKVDFWADTFIEGTWLRQLRSEAKKADVGCLF